MPSMEAYLFLGLSNFFNCKYQLANLIQFSVLFLCEGTKKLYLLQVCGVVKCDIVDELSEKFGI